MLIKAVRKGMMMNSQLESPKSVQVVVEKAETQFLPDETSGKRKKAKLVLKSPTQQRSKQTVSSILDACSKVLVREGFYGITTDKIAKEAGVSIGSLYQFFGNKESVVSALVHNLLEEDKQYFIRTAEQFQLNRLEPRERISKAIDIALSIYSRHSELRAKLQNIQMYLTDVDFFNRTMEDFQTIALGLIPPSDNRDMKKVSYVSVMAFYGLMNYAIANSQDLTKDPEVIKEIHRLFENYIFS